MYHGLSFSLLASFLFATQYFLSVFITGMNSEQIFAWRALITLPVITAFIVASGRSTSIVQLVKRLRDRPLLLVGSVVSSLLMTFQQWLFVWAPLHGRALNVSLGYFILPIVMLLASRMIFRESLSLFKIAAAIAGFAGVALQIYHQHGFSWEPLTVAFGFTAYFVLRRKLGLGGVEGLWMDMLLMMPVALTFISLHYSSPDMIDYPHLSFSMTLLLGVISAFAFMAYINASRLLPMGLFGLLGYVEPVLLVAASLMIGESIKPEEWGTYLLIWLAVAILILEGVIGYWLNRRYVQTS